MAGGNVVAGLLELRKVSREVLPELHQETRSASESLEGALSEAEGAFQGALFDDLGTRYRGVAQQVLEVLQHTVKYESQMIDAVETMVRRYTEAEEEAAERLRKVWRTYADQAKEW